MNKIIMICCVLLAAIQASGQEKVTFSYKMEQGKVYRYKSENNFTATQEMMGNEMKINGNLGTTTRYEVEKVGEDGNIFMVTSKEEAFIRTNMMGKDTTIRQTKDIGKKSGLEISAKGKKLGTTVIDTLSGEDRFLGGNFEFQELPENPVAIGEKWTKTSVDTTTSGEDETITTVTADYELAGTEQKHGHQCLRVNYRKVFGITGKMHQMGMEMFSEGEGETKGTFWFDAEKGLFIAEEFTLNQDITIAVTGQTQMTIPSSQVVNVNVFLIE